MRESRVRQRWRQWGLLCRMDMFLHLILPSGEMDLACSDAW